MKSRTRRNVRQLIVRIGAMTIGQLEKKSCEEFDSYEMTQLKFIALYPHLILTDDNEKIQTLYQSITAQVPQYFDRDCAYLSQRLRQEG